MSEKIQKILAGRGLGSRREIEQWLRDGRISINGKTALLGERITLDAQIRIDGRPVRLDPEKKAKSRVLIYNKPEGEICSRHDPEGRPSVFDRLPLLRNGRWVSIGRLDFNTSGILLFTNDGELAHRFIHPSSNMEREYAVRVQGEVTNAMLTALKKGVALEDGLAHFTSISDQGGEGSNHWYHVTVAQGRNRIVRRLFESQGVMVSRLIRIRFGSLTLPRMLRRGKWEEMTLTQITQLLRPAASEKPTEMRHGKNERHEKRGRAEKGASSRKEPFHSSKKPDRWGGRDKRPNHMTAGAPDARRRSFKRDTETEAPAPFRPHRDRNNQTGKPPYRSSTAASPRKTDAARQSSDRPDRRNTTTPARPQYQEKKNQSDKRHKAARTTSPARHPTTRKVADRPSARRPENVFPTTASGARNKITRWHKDPDATPRYVPKRPKPPSGHRAADAVTKGRKQIRRPALPSRTPHPEKSHENRPILTRRKKPE